MDKSRRAFAVQAMALLLLLSVQACSRPLGFHADEGTAHTDPAQVPFHKAQVTHTASTSADQVQGAAEVLPFAGSQSLPIGTLLTVRLKDPVWTDAPDARGTFEAILDEAVTVDGSTLVPRGAIVSGRVESAHASKIRDNRNYVRLTLDAIDLEGYDFPVQTSSLFARGRSSITATGERKDSLAVIHLEKGRRLIFRLTEPVYVASGRPISTQQLPRISGPSE